MLLPSGPDTVRDSPLRGTRSSTSLEAAALENGDLGWEFSPAGADCRYRAPLVPRLARPDESTADCTGDAQSTQWESARREDSRGEGGVRAPERAHPEVRERGAQAPTRASAVRPGSDGGEGGIRTRDGLPRTAFPVRRHSPLGDLSRASKTGATPTGVGAGRLDGVRVLAERAGFEPAVLSHTAFRERHHQPLGHLSAAEDTKGRWPRTGWLGGPPEGRGLTGPGRSPAAPANSSSASSRRMPLTILRRRWQAGVLGELDDRAGGAVVRVRDGEDERLDVALEERPDAHRAGLERREDRGVWRAGPCRASGPPRAARRRRRGRSGRSTPGPGRGPGRPSPRRRRRPRRSGARPAPAHSAPRRAPRP